jgi:hypothetical protein
MEESYSHKSKGKEHELKVLNQKHVLGGIKLGMYVL